MRVALIGPVYPYRGGIAHYTTLLCRALRDAGHTVLLVSFKRQYPQRLFPGQSDRDPSREPLIVAEAHYWIDSLDQFTWFMTYRHIKRFQPDLVVLPWWTPFLTPVWLTLGVLNQIFSHSPLVYICHNVLPHEGSWLDRLAARLVLKFGTRLIVQSDAEKQRLVSLLPAKHVDIVPHPVYNMFSAKRLSRQIARTELGLAHDIPVLLFFGVVRAYKGLRDMILAMPMIRSCLGDVKLVIAGEFWEDKQPYLDIIKQSNIADLVRIDDHYIPNEDVPRYFSAADLLVAPYHTATGSGVIQMAVGFGLPVITTVEIPLRTDDDRALVSIVDRQQFAPTIVNFFARRTQEDVSPPVPFKPNSDWQELVACVIKGSAA